MNGNNFFERECELLYEKCGNFEMYNSLMETKTETAIDVECWSNGTTRVYHVDVKNGTVDMLRRYDESEKSFLSKLVC